MFAPDPVEAFFSHAEGDDDIYMLAVVFLGGVSQGSGDFIPFGWVVVYDIGNFEDGAVGSFDELKSRLGFCALPFAQFVKEQHAVVRELTFGMCRMVFCLGFSTSMILSV